MRLNNMNMADIMAFIDDDCYELEEKAEKIFDYITNLEAKLAEKDEEIKQLNNRICIAQLQAPKEQILKIIGSSCCQYNPNQDKISFAVENLEKVKEIISQRYRFDVEESDFAVIYEDDIEEIFNQQIKAIKNQKE